MSQFAEIILESCSFCGLQKRRLVQDQINANGLKGCPFCETPATWCDADLDEPHECHIIRCIPCDTNFDMCAHDQFPEDDGAGGSLEVAKRYCADKFNKRPQHN